MKAADKIGTRDPSDRELKIARNSSYLMDEILQNEENEEKRKLLNYNKTASDMVGKIPKEAGDEWFN
jgi:hypothetical protein